MCTVTYIPKQDGFFFTSNRDEQPTRETISPAYYNEQGVNLFYPKDKIAGGTWIGLSENNRLVCLLNGGFVYHNPLTKYPKSRGVVVKTILMSANLLEVLDNIDLMGVAPFTLIVLDWEEQTKMYELVWCREQKHIRKLDVGESYIWSSSTLYNEEMKADRNLWFKEQILSRLEITQDTVIAFHQNEVLGTLETAPKMKRDKVETISTTQVSKKKDVLGLKYYDYTKDIVQVYERVFSEVKL